MHTHLIRLAIPDDTVRLLSLASETGVFKPHEIEALNEVLDDYHAINFDEGHVAEVLISEDRIVGFLYYAPVAMTDRTWELWWIAVDKSLHGHGYGKTLMAHLEEKIRELNGRLVLIDTSSLPNYEATRNFYLRTGYLQVAQIPDFYCDGDDRVIFWKKLESR